MIYYENECRGCATDMYPCRGAFCPFRNVKHYVCDSCNGEFDEGELFYYDGEELCIKCILERLEQVK